MTPFNASYFFKKERGIKGFITRLALELIISCLNKRFDGLKSAIPKFEAFQTILFCFHQIQSLSNFIHSRIFQLQHALRLLVRKNQDQPINNQSCYASTQRCELGLALEVELPGLSRDVKSVKHLRDSRQ